MYSSIEIYPKTNELVARNLRETIWHVRNCGVSMIVVCVSGVCYECEYEAILSMYTTKNKLMPILILHLAKFLPIPPRPGAQPNASRQHCHLPFSYVRGETRLAVVMTNPER